jgi:hypothetical protein
MSGNSGSWRRSALIPILRRLVLFSGLFPAISLHISGSGGVRVLISLALILFGLAGYWLIPWPPHAEGSLRYNRTRGVIIPDLLGYGLCGFFLILGAAAVSGGGAPASVSLFLGAFGILSLSINGIAAWYEPYRIEIYPEGIIRYTILGRNMLEFADMEGAGRMRYDMPEWMKWSAALAALVSWRSTVPLLVQKGRKDPGFRIRMKNGKVYTIWGTVLKGFETIEKAVTRAGIPGLSQ